MQINLEKKNEEFPQVAKSPQDPLFHSLSNNLLLNKSILAFIQHATSASDAYSRFLTNCLQQKLPFISYSPSLIGSFISDSLLAHEHMFLFSLINFHICSFLYSDGGHSPFLSYSMPSSFTHCNVDIFDIFEIVLDIFVTQNSDKPLTFLKLLIYCHVIGAPLIACDTCSQVFMPLHCTACMSDTSIFLFLSCQKVSCQ